MELGLAGQRIAEEIADFTLSLRTDADCEIRIEVDFRIRTPAGDTTFSLGEHSLEATSFSSLLGQTVSSSSVTDSGVFELGFDGETALLVEPDDDYEAWTVAGPGDRKVVCMPDGEIATWGVG